MEFVTRLLHESLFFCDSCNHWVHFKCSGLNKKELNHLSLNNVEWYCKSCYRNIFPYTDVDNDEILALVSEIQNSDNSNHDNVCEDLMSKCLELNEISHTNLTFKDENDNELKLDGNILGCNINSNYLTTEEFSSNLTANNVSKNLSIIHLNCRSLVANFDTVCSFLQTLNCKFDIIALSETWFNENTCTEIFSLNGYNLYTCNRKNKRGGGVLLFVSNKYSCVNIVENMTLAIDNCLEIITVELELYKTKKVSIGCLYRAPNTDIENFNLELYKYLKLVANKTFYICGDYNLDLLKVENNVDTDTFVNNLFSFGFYPIINKPSRITSHSATLIDNIFSNDIKRSINSGLIITDISDHLPIFCISKLKTNEDESTDKFIIKKPVVNSETINTLNKELASVNWNDKVINIKNVNLAYDNFLNIFKNKFSASCPIKHYDSTKRKNTLQNACKRKNNLYKCFLKNRSEETLQKYKSYKNKLTNILRAAEKMYYNEILTYCKGDIKST